MMPDHGNTGDPQKDLVLGLVGKTETSVCEQMMLVAALGILDPRIFMGLLVSHLVSHFYEGLQQNNGEKHAQKWLEGVMEGLSGHFQVHGVQVNIAILRPETFPAEAPKTPEPTEESGFAPEEIQAMKEGRWIDAIKLIRARTGLGLREAKELVDRFRPQRRTCSHCQGRGVVPA